MWDVVGSNFKLFYLHYFWASVALVFLYCFYNDFFKMKQESELISDTDLMERFVEFERRKKKRNV